MNFKVSPFALLMVAGCGLADEQANLPNLPTKEAQEALVAGVDPVRPTVRVLRYLDPPKPAPQGQAPPFPDAKGPDAAAAAAEVAKIQRNIANSSWPEKAPDGKERVVFVDGEAGVEYEYEYDSADLAQLAAVLTARGINNASEGGSAGEPIPPQAEPLGWSNGIDSRVQKPINATYPIDHRVLMRIGELNDGGCSGALVGRRLVLTAAHCVVPQNLASLTHTYRARRSGAQVPYGAPSTSSYWYSGNWVPNNCHNTREHPLCSQHDWAILVLPDNAWASSPNGTPGWMGYWYAPQSELENSVNHNDGYPICTGLPPGFGNDPPAGCVANQPYGQTFAGTATGFELPHEGFPSYYRASMDISVAHSGSPNWTDFPDQNGPYVLGIAMFEHCSGPDCSALTGDYDTHPNGYRGMTPWLANFITSERQANP